MLSRAGGALVAAGWQDNQVEIVPFKQTAYLIAEVIAIPLTGLLTRVSGVPMLEHRLKKNRPGYEDYLRQTSSFFPWPPKKN